jgi:F420-dependent oxidoreductase-like protein
MTVLATRPLRFGVQLQPRRTTWPEYLRAVRTVEELGFDTVWNFDHMLSPAGDPADPCFETWTTLSAMAACTSRIGVGALVNGVLYRDPATLAKSAAMVDHISGGRLQFALGAAWNEPEFRAYGLPFPSLGERMSRLEETLEIVKMLWTQARTTYQGRYYTIADAPCEPKPLQQPYPPIMIGGTGRRTLRLTAKYAGIWNGIGTPASIADAIETLRASCAEIGRELSEIELTVHPPQLVIAPTNEAAEAKAREITGSLGLDFEEERDSWLIGSPDAVRAQIQRYADLGITHWIIGAGAPFDLEGLRLFAGEVLPAFR